MSYAAKVLSDHIQLFIDLSNIGDGPTIIKNTTEQNKPSDTIKDKTILDLDLGVRAYNCLKRAGINTIGDLTKLSPVEVNQIRNLGKKSLDEILQKLADMGLLLNMEKEE